MLSLFALGHAVEHGAVGADVVIAQNDHSIEMRHLAVGMAILLGERLGLGFARDVGDGDRGRIADQALLVGTAIDIFIARRACTEAEQHKSETSDRVDGRHRKGTCPVTV